MNIDDLGKVAKGLDPMGFDLKSFLSASRDLAIKNRGDFNTSRIQYGVARGGSTDIDEVSDLTLYGLQRYNVNLGREWMLTMMGDISERLEIGYECIGSSEGRPSKKFWFYTFSAPVIGMSEDCLREGVEKIYRAQNALILLMESQIRSSEKRSSSVYAGAPIGGYSGLGEYGGKGMGGRPPKRDPQLDKILKIGRRKVMVRDRICELAGKVVNPETGKIRGWGKIARQIKEEGGDSIDAQKVRVIFYKRRDAKRKND